ncbi:hypothetical protein [Legionella shakespearei]|nr:hypothetical protein [Legionella shakespearei]
MLFFFAITSCYAEPPEEVINSCREEKKAHPLIKFEELYVSYDTDNQKITSCPDDSHRSIIRVEVNNYSFYQEHCGSQEFFLADKRILPLDQSVNHSLSPDVKPYGVTHISEWYLISYRGKDYICMSSGLSENGSGAATSQYYIVENAFDDKAPLTSHFYFFDKEFIEELKARR